MFFVFELPNETNNQLDKMRVVVQMLLVLTAYEDVLPGDMYDVFYFINTFCDMYYCKNLH